MYPTYRMDTFHEENDTYITMNKGRRFHIPDVIAAKSIGIAGDIAEVLEQLVHKR